MTMRMFKYDFKIALERSELEKHILSFSQISCSVSSKYSFNTESATVILETPGGTMTYQMPVLKMQDYSLEDIFSKKLYFLIPFYLFTFEQHFDTMEEKEYDLLPQRYHTRHVP